MYMFSQKIFGDIKEIIMTNPYDSPLTSDRFNDDFEAAEMKFFSFSGRIGRLRYLAYNVLISICIFAVLLVFGIIAAVIGGGSGAETLGAAFVIFFVILYAVAMVFSFSTIIRRLHDYDWTGWALLLLIIPLANIVIALMLLFMPGTSGTNRFGKRPPKNGAGVIVGAVSIPVLMVLFVFIAAMAIPGYQAYMEKAKQTERNILQEQQEQYQTNE